MASLLLLTTLAPASAKDELPRVALRATAPQGAPLAIVVHGINPTKGSLDPLADSLVRRGFLTYQFHYDDHQDLDRSATELATITTALIGQHAPPEVVIVAHSMGGLVSRRALTRDHPIGLGKFKVTLITVASPFGGFRSANWARWDLGIGPASYDDLGTRSKFISDPGTLSPSVTHIKVETVEKGRTLRWGGEELDDDRIRLKSQRQDDVDREASERLQIERGHLEVVATDGDVSAPLSRLFDRVLRPARKANPPRRGLGVALGQIGR